MSKLHSLIVATVLLCILSNVGYAKEGEVALYDEAATKAIVSEGIKIEGWSKVDDPSNPGMFVQYRRVLKIEKVVTGTNGKKPWYYLVYFGPVIPQDGGWVFWPAGDPPPWRKIPNISSAGPVVFTTVHEHYGCDIKKSYCKRHDNVPVRFDSLQQGKVTGKFGDKGFDFEGNLNGTILEFTYNAGSAGKGHFNFSPDFRSFYGSFSDEAGHRGLWWGSLN
jgi:hypothetical protein